MGTLDLNNRRFEYQWASDVAFDGIRLEVLSDEGQIYFDVSLPDEGTATINTFGNEVAADLIVVAVQFAQRSRSH